MRASDNLILATMISSEGSVYNHILIAMYSYEGPGQPNPSAHVFYQGPVYNHILTAIVSPRADLEIINS